ncbi:hypothetical protein DEO72_LG8g1179 [Vigna unguiculata]|uniref:Uncharacterized protein n=1 Tax=Vigna unguiculata TaxID=3917 RepID=A0A4D6MTD3_VIGUN|nr:hypothetical protein DEO72_LG8g1179 [Vigna unguiculata]
MAWHPAQAGIPILSEGVSRSGESLSPKREFEECSGVGFTRSPGERRDSWAICGLAQASVTRLSECSRLVLCVMLAQASVVYKASKISRWWACWCSMGYGPERILELWLGIRVKHVAFYGLWPVMTSLELWLGLTSVAGVSVLVVASTDGSRWIVLLSDSLTS